MSTAKALAPRAKRLSPGASRLALRAKALALGASHVALGASWLALGARHVALGARHVALGARHVALGASHVARGAKPFPRGPKKSTSFAHEGCPIRGPGQLIGVKDEGEAMVPRRELAFIHRLEREVLIMGSKIIPNQNTALALDQKVVVAVGKYFAKVKKLTLAGIDHTPATLKAVFQGEIDANTAIGPTRTQLKQQVAAARVARAKAHETRKALKAYVLGNYGAAAVQMLEDLGISVPKPPGKPTADTRAKAVLKAEATRKARGTMGRKQKLRIKAEPSQVAAPAATVTPKQ